MTAYKGYRVEIRLPLQQFVDSPTIKEDGSLGVGDGVTTHFYTPYFPIVDSSGNVTNDPADVTVKVNGTALDPTTDYTIDGSEGLINLVSAPASGAGVTVTYYTKTTIGYARSLEYSSDNKADAFEALGSRYPVTIEYGPQEVSITLERAYVDRLFSHIFDKEEPEVEIGIDFDGDETDDLTVQGQVSRYSVTTSTNDFIIARIEFVGKRV